ncbi:MAG: hypothetical protein LIR25_08470, partial [bacterium]|nr:hypothetical protein [bacterium]
MGTVSDCINNRIKTLDLLISRLQESISKRAEGDLVISVQRGYVRFYQSFPGSKKKYLSKADYETVESLAQKQYEQKLLDAALEERKLLADCLAQLAEIEPKGTNHVLDSMDESIHGCIVP